MECREASFCLSDDIRAAHRLVKVRRRDWPYMCCKADTESPAVWVNKFGTFGISSAPYWWAKLFALGALLATSWVPGLCGRSAWQGEVCKLVDLDFGFRVGWHSFCLPQISWRILLRVCWLSAERGLWW